MLEKLLDTKSWNEFIKSKLDNNYSSIFSKRKVNKILANNTYKDISKSIVDGEYQFSIPTKHIISKNSSSKRRVVYLLSLEESFVLKHISYLLYQYDDLFAPNLYSFRKKTGVKSAINEIRKKHNLGRLYGYKLDISNYFNSINIDLFLDELKDNVDDDVFNLFSKLYSDKRVSYRIQIIEENKGAMAGVPLSAFAANFYIRNIDEFFYKEKIFYLRYADDIIFFTKSKDDRDKYIRALKTLLNEKHLSINEDKVSYIEPGEYFEFLGFGFDGKTIDISKHSMKKIKSKIKRQARRLLMWKDKKNLPPEKALTTINKKFNKKFYGKVDNETSWSYWYFPIINTSKSLKEVDAYFQDEQRYLYTGRHNKMNYKKCPYETLKSCGYKPLVHEYYEFRKNKDK